MGYNIPFGARKILQYIKVESGHTVPYISNLCWIDCFCFY